jgi:hypothetical protein
MEQRLHGGGEGEAGIELPGMKCTAFHTNGIHSKRTNSAQRYWAETITKPIPRIQLQQAVGAYKGVRCMGQCPGDGRAALLRKCHSPTSNNNPHRSGRIKISLTSNTEI